MAGGDTGQPAVGTGMGGVAGAAGYAAGQRTVDEGFGAPQSQVVSVIAKVSQ